MHGRLRSARLALVLALGVGAGAPSPAMAEAMPDASASARSVEIPADFAEGLPVAMVYVHLRESTGDAAQDEALANEITTAFGLRQGGTFRKQPADFGLKRVRQLESVASAELRLYRMVSGGDVAVALLVTPATEAAVAAPAAKGMLETGKFADFPTIYEGDESKFVFILNGGVGIFSDGEPWFGGYGDAFNGTNPTAQDPLGPGTSTWLEAYVEPGLAGISRIAASPLYAYGEVSYLMSGSSGHDIYNSGTRGYGDWEKLYAGLLWDLPGEGNLVDATFGRQVYQLRDGFLLSKIPVSTSIGERAALYLGPRLTSERTALLRARLSDFGLDAFLIEPSEIEEIASDTRLAGVNLKYPFANAEAAFTYFYIPESKSSFRAPDGTRLPREGLRTYNPSLSVKKLFGFDGAWLKTEYAWQDHEDFDMSADAGYVWLGYRMAETRWQPAFSYRWSTFSGDDPDTATFERFDPLFSGGLGNFLPGIVFSKVYKNANLTTHRATLSLKPKPNLELILDYFQHRANDLNNLGGIGPLQTLASTDIGQEVTFTAYHYIGRHLFLQGIASVGLPGEAIEQALGGDTENWYTLQLALYMFF